MNIYKIETSEIEFWAARNLPELFNAYKEDYGECLLEIKPKITSIPESKWDEHHVYDRDEENDDGSPLFIGSFDELVILDTDPYVLSSTNY